jgi:hypothetical protein
MGAVQKKKAGWGRWSGAVVEAAVTSAISAPSRFGCREQEEGAKVVVVVIHPCLRTAVLPPPTRHRDAKEAATCGGVPVQRGRGWLRRTRLAEGEAAAAVSVLRRGAVRQT